MIRSSLIALLCASTLALGGCRTLNVTYAPSSSAAPAPNGTQVVVKVDDARPTDNGGGTNEVGQVRSGVGIPSGLKDKDPNVVKRTVEEATVDALKHAGVATGSGKTLEATVKEYWMDGYMGYKGSVTVEYKLKDSAGKTLWTRTVTGADGGSNAFRDSYSMTEEIFRKALAEVSANATKEFLSADFHAAAKDGAAAEAPAAAPAAE